MILPAPGHIFGMLVTAPVSSCRTADGGVSRCELGITPPYVCLCDGRALLKDT
ncbi:hypothetical protein JOB18_021883 [Solea senegalensis]|uniref:Uncharacterized protein n=1 Tax=Solea senegalensis TaxID=28829 RepID=A0AAV6RY10_SOLSE|nr:hypothetical protein JOB18_021883 [Solea senegalensis]